MVQINRSNQTEGNSFEKFDFVFVSRPICASPAVGEGGSMESDGMLGKAQVRDRRPGFGGFRVT
jgi:hypothetical protein